MGENYSLTDLATVTNGGANGGSWIWILLFLVIFNNGGWGNRGNVATTDELNNATNFTRLENQVRSNADLTERKTDAIINGICSSSYENLRNYDTLRYESALSNKDLSAQMAIGFSANKEAIHAEGEATRALIQQNKIEALQQKVSALEMQNAMCGVVRYPTTMSYTAGTSPFCNCNSGCGCGNI